MTPHHITTLYPVLAGDRRLTLARVGLPETLRVAVRAVLAPKPGGAIDTDIIPGDRFAVHAREDGWAYGQSLFDGYAGWLPSASLAPTGPAPTHVVTAPRSFVYEAASLKSPPLAALPLNAEVAVAAVEGDYARLADGGFVHRAHLAPLGTFAPDWVAVAEALAGVPYLWGGVSPEGLDCSGLVQTALRRAGMLAPRDSDMQAKALGRDVPVTEDFRGLRRGDLVCWKGHIGIMRDPVMLLHANAHHMMVATEPLAGAAERIAGSGSGPVTAIRRL